MKKIGLSITPRFFWGEAKYQKLREIGFTHVDLDLANTELPCYTGSPEQGKALMLRERAAMNEAGIRPSQVHGPWRWPCKDDTEEDRAERMEKMKRSIGLTAALGCPYWVIHGIMPYGAASGNRGHEEEVRQINKAFFGELLQTAKACGVTICLENLPFPEYPISSPEQVLRFVQEMDDEHFKICLDTGHVAVYNDRSPAEVARLMGKEIRVLHVHDNRFHIDLHLPPYYGVIDWPDFGKALRDIGFDGVFSYEASVPRQLSPEAAEHLCRAMVLMTDTILD